MDIPLSQATTRARRRRPLIATAVGLVLLAGATTGLFSLKPAAPRVERQQLWTDTVKRGDMLRQVRGPGTLVPEEVLWIPALVPGRIVKILVLPGAPVAPDTVILELSNPELEKAVFDAEWQLKAAEAETANLKVQLRSQHLNQQSVVAAAQSSANNTRLDADVNEELAKSGLTPKLVLKQSKSKADDAAQLLEIEKERLKISAEAAQAQEAVQQARVEQLRAELKLKREQAASLKVRAGISGVLQRLGETGTLQVGQQLAAGASVARVADPARLKAEVRIHETQAKDIQLGQPALIDTRNGTVPGRVARIDSAVQNGTVTVDIALAGPLPRGARPDLSVDGTVELERLAGVTYVSRPVAAEENATLSVFKLTANGQEAVRVPVKFGRSSVGTIEVRDGLREGDQIILSDMAQWQDNKLIRLN
jgi:HlyD family secretion protein